MAANVKELPKTDRELSVMIKAGGRMAFSEAISSADEQYQQRRAAYVATLSQEQLGAIQRNAAKPRQTGRRITIEREQVAVVYRSQCPYVGITRLFKGRSDTAKHRPRDLSAAPDRLREGKQQQKRATSNRLSRPKLPGMAPGCGTGSRSG